jgi:uncharacterized protein YtpQ (UPF0354 family)
MLHTDLKNFVHPHEVYNLQYPAEWELVVQKDGESCGFGPYNRDDVGLWISIMPMSVDTSRLEKDLPEVMQNAMPKVEAENMRRDENLRHFGLIADMTKEGQAGNYWIMTGGDVVLFASSQVPPAERDIWNPPFWKLMASIQITRDEELLMRQIANETLLLLREKHPEQEFEFHEQKIRGKDRMVYLGNLFREVRSSPDRREELVKHFVDKLSQPVTADLGNEQWDDVRSMIIPVLKPKNYIDPNSPTQHLLTREWLADVLICYAIMSQKTFRFVTGWDVDRWGTTADELDEIARANLTKLPWPTRLMGARAKDDGRLIIVDTDDSLASSRLLHPDLHRMFAGPLGNPFWAGIPCRNRLVLYSDRKALKNRTVKKLKRDHDDSAYPITPRPFLVTRDGIAAAK